MLWLTVCILLLFFYEYKDKVRNVSVKEYDDTSAILSWPELTNSSINSTLISGFVVNYNSTSMKHPCHNGIIVSSLQVRIYCYLKFSCMCSVKRFAAKI